MIGPRGTDGTLLAARILRGRVRPRQCYTLISSRKTGRQWAIDKVSGAPALHRLAYVGLMADRQPLRIEVGWALLPDWQMTDS